MVIDPNPFDVGDDETRKQVAIRYYCRHLVSLAGWGYRIDDKGNVAAEASGFAFSGFVLSIRDNWMLVTAGHILRDVLPKNWKAEGYLLLDGWGLKAIHRDAIPFDYEGAVKWPVHEKEQGLDFGLILLRPMYRDLLEANGIEPISEANWMNAGKVACNEHFILGLPTVVMDRIKEGDIERGLRPIPMIIPVTKLDSPPNGHEKTFPRFCGKIFGSVTISDMDGMSGAPIIGVGEAPDGNRRYWVVAVQSAWLSTRRIVFACPVLVFAGFVERRLMITEAERHAEGGGAGQI